MNEGLNKTNRQKQNNCYLPSSKQEVKEFGYQDLKCATMTIMIILTLFLSITILNNKSLL